MWKRQGGAQSKTAKAKCAARQSCKNNAVTKYVEVEIFVSESINELVHISLQEKDYATHNFLQWYVAEQIEEEATARTILDKINMIGDDKGGLYLFDRDIQQLTVVSSAAPEPGA